jgi:hypothetical protein
MRLSAYRMHKDNRGKIYLPLVFLVPVLANKVIVWRSWDNIFRIEGWGYQAHHENTVQTVSRVSSGVKYPSMSDSGTGVIINITYTVYLCVTALSWKITEISACTVSLLLRVSFWLFFLWQADKRIGISRNGWQQILICYSYHFVPFLKKGQKAGSNRTGNSKTNMAANPCADSFAKVTLQ